MNKLLSKIKGHFRKPEIEFDKPLTSADIVRMVKTKQFYELKKLMPRFNWGQENLSRSKSALVILGFLLGVGLSVLIGNPLPLLLSVLSLAFGSEDVFNSAESNYISVSLLDSTHFVVAYQDKGGDYYGCAKVGTIDGTDITFGSEYIFNSALSYYLSVASLDSTHFVVVFTDSGGDSYGYAMIGTVSNTDEIAYGSEYVYSGTNTCNYNAVAKIDSTHFVIAYKSDSDGKAIIGTVSSVDEIAYGSEYIFNNSASSHVSVSLLDSTHFVVAFTDAGNNVYGTAIVGTISSVDEIAYGSEYTFNAVYTLYTSVSALDSTHFVIAYKNNVNTFGYTVVGTVSSVDEIAYGSLYVFNSSVKLDFPIVSKLDSSHFVVVYRDNGTSYNGTAVIGTISSVDEVAYGSKVVFNSSFSQEFGLTAIDSTHFIIGYEDKLNSKYGTTIIGTYTAVSGPANIKSWNGVAIANIKSINGISISSIKSINGLE